MVSAIQHFRDLCNTPAEAIHWACVLEATAPKAGNVYPGRSFTDLTYSDFVSAAEIAARCLSDTDLPIAERMLAAIVETTGNAGSNVNLGIVLLLGPLVAADQARTTVDSPFPIAEILDRFTPADGQLIYRAIVAASPGGLGQSETNDVRTTDGPIDILAAMTQAADRDRVARQYATRFADLIDNVAPLVHESIRATGDVLIGIAQAHLRLLAGTADSLIARKHGDSVAEQVRKQAAKININDPVAIRGFDTWLRADRPIRNPGTTADLIAASLYWILRNNDE